MCLAGCLRILTTLSKLGRFDCFWYWRSKYRSWNLSFELAKFSDEQHVRSLNTALRLLFDHNCFNSEYQDGWAEISLLKKHLAVTSAAIVSIMKSRSHTLRLKHATVTIIVLNIALVVIAVVVYILFPPVCQTIVQDKQIFFIIPVDHPIKILVVMELNQRRCHRRLGFRLLRLIRRLGRHVSLRMK